MIVAEIWPILSQSECYRHKLPMVILPWSNSALNSNMDVMYVHISKINTIP